MPQSPCEVEGIVAGLDGLPDVDLEVNARCKAARVRVGARVVAQIDLRRGAVAVYTPAQTIHALQQVFPSARPAANGIVFDPAASSQALAAIRRQVKVERLVRQFRVASP